MDEEKICKGKYYVRPDGSKFLNLGIKTDVPFNTKELLKVIVDGKRLILEPMC